MAKLILWLWSASRCFAKWSSGCWAEVKDDFQIFFSKKGFKVK